MADNGILVRFDDGRGNMLKLTRKQAEERVRNTPGSFIVGEKATPAEVEIEAVSEDMTVAKLREFAKAHEVELAGARTKGDIIQRLEEAGFSGGDTDFSDENDEAQEGDQTESVTPE